MVRPRRAVERIEEEDWSATCCSALHSAALEHIEEQDWSVTCCSVLHFIAACCAVLHSVAACCTVLHLNTSKRKIRFARLFFNTRYNTLQRTATHCNTLQHAATHCHILQQTWPPSARLFATYTYTHLFLWGLWNSPIFEGPLTKSQLYRAFEIALSLWIALPGGEDAYGAWSCRSFFAKEPLIIGLFCGKWPAKIRRPMRLGHPVEPCRTLYVHTCRTLYVHTCTAYCIWSVV